MANRITIPTLKSQITPLRIAEIDTERNPYRSVVASLADLGKAAGEAEARDRFFNQTSDDESPPPPDPHVNAGSAAGAGMARAGEAGGFFSWDDFLRRQAEENRRQRKQDIEDTFGDLSDAAYNDPYRIGDYRDEADELLRIIPDDEREEFAPKRAQLNESYLRGLIRDNPKLALEMLRSRKGFAEEDLGISEETREDLEALAQSAFDFEQIRFEIERHAQTLQAAIWTKTVSLFPRATRDDVWRGYGDVIDAIERDAKTADWLEPQVDKIVREAKALADSVTKAAARIVAGGAVDWGRSKHVEALDQFARNVVGEDTWSEPARHRMIWASRAANRAPEFVRESIRTGVHSRDTVKRAFAGRLLMDLDDSLLDWAPPDIRTFGDDFGALIGAGVSDQSAIRRIQAGKELTQEQREARVRTFRANLDGDGVLDALNRALHLEDGEMR